MTGREVKAMVARLFGKNGATSRAARYLQVSRSRLQRAYRQARVPRILEKALKQVERELAERPFSEVTRESGQ